MAPAVFKTDVARYPGQAGSIPVHLRTLDLDREAGDGGGKQDGIVSLPGSLPTRTARKALRWLDADVPRYPG